VRGPGCVIVSAHWSFIARGVQVLTRAPSGVHLGSCCKSRGTGKTLISLGAAHVHSDRSRSPPSP